LGLGLPEGGDLLGVVAVVEVADGQLPGPVQAVQVVAVGRFGALALQLLADFLALLRGTASAYLGRSPGLSKTRVMVPTGLAPFLSRRWSLSHCFAVLWWAGTALQA
jgi:hypothetical protein